MSTMLSLLAFTFVFELCPSIGSSPKCLYANITSHDSIFANLCPPNYDTNQNDTWSIWTGLNIDYPQCVICHRKNWINNYQCNKTQSFSCGGSPLYASDGVSFWKLLSPSLQPIGGYKYGTIQFKRNMYLQFTFKFNGYNITTESGEFLSIFRIGGYASGSQYNCDLHGSRYPAFYTVNNKLHSVLSNNFTCWGNQLAIGYLAIPEFNMSVNGTYSIEMRYDRDSVYLAVDYVNPYSNITIHEIIFNGSYETRTPSHDNMSVIIGDPVSVAAHVTILDLLIISYDDNFTLNDYQLNELITTQQSTDDVSSTTIEFTDQQLTTTDITDLQLTTIEFTDQQLTTIDITDLQLTTTYFDKDAVGNNNVFIVVIIVVVLMICALVLVYCVVSRRNNKYNISHILGKHVNNNRENEQHNGIPVIETQTTSCGTESIVTIVDKKMIKKEYYDEGQQSKNKNETIADGELLECVDCGSVEPGKVYEGDGEFYCFDCWAKYEQYHEQTIGYTNEGNANEIDNEKDLNQTNGNSSNNQQLNDNIFVQDLGDDFEIIGDDNTAGQRN